MSIRLSFTLVRFVSIAFVNGFFVLGAFAQAYNPATDPLVQRSVSVGEQMTPFESNRDLNVRDPRWSNLSSTINQRLAFPPPPPALGEELPVAGPAGSVRSPAAEFDRELFYGAYSILLGRNQLSAQDTGRISAYRARRLELLQELQTKFAALAGAAPAARAAALAELARQQEGRLQSLAAEAEAIRDDLAWTGSSYEFNLALRAGGFRFAEPGGKFLGMFFAAYFNAGLSTEQRLLLTELAYEQLAGARGEKPKPPADGSAYFSFLPATARIRLPANLPPDLAAKIQAFAGEKERLKSELRSAVMDVDYFFVGHRTKRFTTLAGEQAPRFAALDALAEEIRIGLAGCGYPDLPGAPDLPAELTQRVGNFYARKVEVQRELLNRLRTLAGEIPSARFAIARQGDGLAIVQTAVGAKPAPGLAEFNAGLARRYTAFASESALLRRDIQHYTETVPNRATRTVDQLAADFATAYAAQENWNRYRDYARAVLEPGLSAAQRRLLFQAAAAELDQAGRQPQP